MAKKMWGGRFRKGMDKRFEGFSSSIAYDYKLAEFDLVHSLIHTRVLQENGILTVQEANRINAVLEELLKSIKDNRFKPNLSAEDIHTDIQNRLEKKIGPLSLKLHTLRSRNDQVVFDEKLFCGFEASMIGKLLINVCEVLLAQRRKYSEQPFVGYTHGQRAQVILFSDYLDAYFYMFRRDVHRVVNYTESLQAFIGAGALAGSGLSRSSYERAIKDFLRTTPVYGKIRPVVNSLESVADRDFVIEFLGLLSIVQMHLSRLAEDMILYSTQEFNYLDLPEEFCTGSSLMPHKKNPDFLELVRGSSGRINGNLVSVLTILKGLPLAYNRDMQLDKEPLFSSVETVKEELTMLKEFLAGLKLKEKVIEQALTDETLYATDLAEFLVLKKVSFREAHDIVGRMIRYVEDKGMRLSELPDELLISFHRALNQKEMQRIINPFNAVASRKSISRKAPKI